MKSLFFSIVACIVLTACVGTRDLSKLNRDTRCLHPSDVVYGNRRNNNEEVYVKTLSFDDRVFVGVYNKLGQTLGYRDIYGTELTNADLEAIGPYYSEVNTLSFHTTAWQYRREQFLKFPELFPNRGQPYKALPRPTFCDAPVGSSN